MSPEAKQRVQLVLVIALLVAGVRTAFIFYKRHQDAVEAEKQKQARNVGYSNADYYVYPKKLHPYDLKSAKQLTQQPVWVKEGYRYTYYPYDSGGNHVDFSREAGLLLPIEQLMIKAIITAMPPGKGQQKQVMAVFAREGKTFAVPIGVAVDEQYTIYSDEMFFIENPRDLYKHWPADVWQAVERHEVKPGMNEMMADFAIGMGVPDAGASSYEKTVRYPDGGKPLVIVYRDGKATEIKAGEPGS